MNMKVSDDNSKLSTQEKRLQYRKAYHKRDKKKYKEYQKEYYKKNKEKLRQKNKKYRAQNKKEIKQQKKEYRAKNKEKIRQRNKEYREKTKEKMNQHQNNKKIKQQNKEKLEQHIESVGKDYNTDDFAYNIDGELIYTEMPEIGTEDFQKWVYCKKKGYGPLNSDNSVKVYQCPHCNGEFKYKSIFQFAGHKSSCRYNPSSQHYIGKKNQNKKSLQNKIKKEIESTNSRSIDKQQSDISDESNEPERSFDSYINKSVELPERIKDKSNQSRVEKYLQYLDSIPEDQRDTTLEILKEFDIRFYSKVKKALV